MKKKILLSSTLACLLFFAGCGVGTGADTNSSTETNSTSTTSSNSVTKTTTSGVVADGYIKGATVCIDLNDNNKCDSDEPTVITNNNGNYNISYNGDITGKTLIASGGFDINRSIDFNSTLESVIENDSANITPITTFTKAYAKVKGISFSNAKQAVASILGISENEIGANPEINDNLAKLSLKIELAVETAAKLKAENPLSIYSKLATSASIDTNWSEIVANAFTNNNIKAAIETVDKQVDNVTNISNLQNIQNTIINTVKSAMDANITVSNDTIENALNINQALNELNLSENIFQNKIASLQNEVQTDINISKVASIDDVKKTIQVIRDTSYEFLDPNLDNQEQNTSTIAGEVVSNYNNAIKPAINNLNSDINSSLDLIDKATKQFDKDLDDEFNTSVTDLNNRLQAISNVLNEYNETTDFNATTDYNDTISYTYSKDDNGYITETYELNGKTLTAKFYENQFTGSYLASEPVSLSKDGEYNISLNSLSFDGNKFIFNANGVIYDKNDTSKKIEVSNATFNFDVNTTYLDNTLNKALAFSNVDANISANITTDNGYFSGEIVLNNNAKYLKGELDYTNFNGVKLNGILKINTSTNNILKIVNDDNLKYDSDWWMNKNLILVDGNLAVKKVEYNYNYNNNTVSHEENLTAINGEIAHCTITDIYNDNIQNHTVNCDKNVTSIPIEDKIVKAKIDGKDVVLDYMDVSINNDTYEFYYNFDNSSGYGYHISPNTTNVNISDITVANPTNALDVSGDVKFSGNVITPKTKLSLNLTAQSEGNGKVYNLIASDINITNNSDFALIKSLNVTEEKPNKVEYQYYSNYIRNYNEDNSRDDNTTKVLLQGLNATLYDTNNNPISINNANVLADIQNGNGYIYGNIAYLDFNMTGFAGYEKNGINNLVTLYLDIERNGYEPFILGANSTFNDENSYSNAVIKKGNYILSLKENYDEINGTNNLNVKGYDSNGVFINVIKQGNNDANITIIDKDGNSLATFDPKTNTVTYNDGSSETLY